MKIRAIRVGSAVKYGVLFSAVYPLLTGIPSAIATIAIQRLIINLLAPVIRLFHGSTEDPVSERNSPLNLCPPDREIGGLPWRDGLPIQDDTKKLYPFYTLWEIVFLRVI
jgi:hypothetical protein